MLAAGEDMVKKQCDASSVHPRPIVRYSRWAGRCQQITPWWTCVCWRFFPPFVTWFSRWCRRGTLPSGWVPLGSTTLTMASICHLFMGTKTACSTVEDCMWVAVIAGMNPTLAGGRTKLVKEYVLWSAPLHIAVVGDCAVPWLRQSSLSWRFTSWYDVGPHPNVWYTASDGFPTIRFRAATLEWMQSFCFSTVAVCHVFEVIPSSWRSCCVHDSAGDMRQEKVEDRRWWISWCYVGRHVWRSALCGRRTCPLESEVVETCLLEAEQFSYSSVYSPRNLLGGFATGALGGGLKGTSRRCTWTRVTSVPNGSSRSRCQCYGRKFFA